VNNVPEIKNFKVGLLHLFIQHTSAGLTLNEYLSLSLRLEALTNNSVETGIQMSEKT